MKRWVEPLSRCAGAMRPSPMAACKDHALAFYTLRPLRLCVCKRHGQGNARADEGPKLAGLACRQGTTPGRAAA